MSLCLAVSLIFCRKVMKAIQKKINPYNLHLVMGRMIFQVKAYQKIHFLAENQALPLSTMPRAERQ